jgi:hypothetical protein
VPWAAGVPVARGLDHKQAEGRPAASAPAYVALDVTPPLLVEEVYFYQISGEAPEGSRHGRKLLFSRLFGVTLLIVPWVSPVAGAELSPHPPTFSQVLVFGDSTLGSGYFRTLPNPGAGKDFGDVWPQALAAGAGEPTTRPGFVYSEMLASCYGLNAVPGDQPGGTNFATSGAKNETVNKRRTRRSTRKAREDSNGRFPRQGRSLSTSPWFTLPTRMAFI